jgi:HTH-type transcriptional regulator / antitoxin HigA
LLELLEERGISQTEVAQRMGRPVKTINEIIRGKAAITPETALELEKVFGTPAYIWLALEQSYREALARQAESDTLAEYKGWMKQFPVRKMQKLGWVATFSEPNKQLVALLQFFGIAHPDSFADVWDNCLVDYRLAQAYSSNGYALAAWLRQGEIEAQEIRCAPYDKGLFKSLLLGECRALTLLEDFAEVRGRLTEVCARAGVAFTAVPEIDGARISGAARWLHKNKAIIQLSLRYKSNDQFWFSFFHEAAHILRHGKREFFTETDDNASASDQKEQEANQLARDMLIPASAYKRFVHGRDQSLQLFQPAGRCQFAQQINIAPGIVVGRLQHDGYLPATHLNGLKVKYDWA